MITIDARWINTSGMGSYLRNLLPGVIATFPNQKFCLLGEVKTLSTLDWTKSENITLIEMNSPMYSLTEQLVMINKIPRDTKLFWSTHYNVPLFYRGAMFVTIYDLYHLAMPKLVGGWHKSLYAKLMFHMVHLRALAILTISHFSEGEFRLFTGSTRQSIYPIHLGVAKAWFEITPSSRPYSNKYILFVGNVKPHKNLSGLVNAYSLIFNCIPHDLVIVGKKEGFITGDSVVTDLATNLGSRIHFTGYVDDAALHQFFVHAEAMVFPSLYEGFGLPPLEAMAARCPVLVSNAGPMPEVCGDAALYCDPHNVADMASKLLSILTDEPLRLKLRKLGLEHARTFTWDKCIAQTCEVIRGLLDKECRQIL
jgi:glycosyltransferase involved in cell wall biosynthesis